MTLEAYRSLPIEQRIDLFLQELSAGRVSIDQLLNQGLTLAGERLDSTRVSKGIPPGVLSKFNYFKESTKVEIAYWQGFNGGKVVAPDEIEKEGKTLGISVEGHSQTINFNKILWQEDFGKVANLGFIVATVGEGGFRSPRGRLDHWRYLQEDLQGSRVPNRILALIYLDLLASHALRKIKLKLGTLLDSKNEVLILEGQEEEFWRNILIGKPGIEGINFCLGYFKKVASLVYTGAEDFFGDIEGAKKGIDLWRSMLFLRTRAWYKPPVVGPLKNYRRPVFELIGEQRFEEAEFLVRELIFRKPDCFTETTKGIFSVSSQDIENYRVANLSTKLLSQDEREKIRRRKLVELVRKRGQQRLEDTSEAKMAGALLLKGKTFVELFAFTTPEGESVRLERIRQVEGMGQLTHKYADIDSDGNIVMCMGSFPAVVVRNVSFYGVQGGRTPKTGDYKVFPGTLLRQIENGQLIPIGR